MTQLFNGIYRNKTVLITGHTGFKGSWLALWLERMGARVIGYALEAPTTPDHLSLLTLDIISILGDIRDSKKLETTFGEFQPDIVFHLAAQPLVRRSYADPLTTYETNVMGTLNVLEACRKHNVKAIVNITSDKHLSIHDREVIEAAMRDSVRYSPASSATSVHGLKIVMVTPIK